MTHNAANAIGHAAHLAFVAVVSIYISPWCLLLIYPAVAGSFRTDKEIDEAKTREAANTNCV